MARRFIPADVVRRILDGERGERPRSALAHRLAAAGTYRSERAAQDAIQSVYEVQQVEDDKVDRILSALDLTHMWYADADLREFS